ncbi:hypothetical protein VTN96DRAFT_7533 [Rasamsonia emersonii]|uniref:Allergen Asp f 4 n=1 Tax=Rasamsonia emersonii (strain ATCC 16479 / CBS 393.64 / IMI 116815) TaxID=1408163 RepID=A0A0F4YSD7_RASE3|nr:Allergen Asp f 4 [Rasamsonia emersonii CBS 393.64]KKA21025.1 Allergen Asp f 4 [Rasamsonia emersonii CBS 393.64]
MQLKNSLVLLTALTAGSAVARLHGHERRHQHHQRNVEERGVGDVVTATIDGQVVSWINEWSGVAPTAAAEASSSSSAPAESSAIPTASATSSSSSGTATGFGARTSPHGSGINYVGNVGNPWGSNIIQISENEVSKYKYTLKFLGDSITEPWTVVFWNKIGPDGKLDGWYGYSALQFQINPGETKYVACDEDTQGAFGAAPGNTLPKDADGGWASSWGEFDFGNSQNGGWSGFDVSVIQAQNAGLPIQGLKICDAANENTCSSIASRLSNVVNAYTNKEAAEGGIGGNIPPGPLALNVYLNYH